MPLRYSASINNGLAPTAQNLLQAARRIVTRRGYAGLSTKAIGEEAGVNPSLIHYYFGSKEGLVEALVSSLVEDPGLPLPRGDGRSEVEELIEGGRQTWADRREFRLYNELLPHILRSKKLRQGVAAKYESIRRTHAEHLTTTSALDEQTSEMLTALSLALLDGLGLQSSLDPEGFDQQGAMALWCELVEVYMRARSQEDAEPTDRAAALDSLRRGARVRKRGPLPKGGTASRRRARSA